MTATVRPALPLDDAVDRLGLGPFQWRRLAICGLTWAADAMEVLLMGRLAAALTLFAVAALRRWAIRVEPRGRRLPEVVA